MKNIFKLIGLIAFAAVIGFGMAACDSGGGGGNKGGDPVPVTSITYTSVDPDGNTHKLVIKDSAAKSVVRNAYAPKAGDSYTLTITNPGGTVIGTSTGTVTNVSGSTFTFQQKDSDETFTLTVSGTSVTSGTGVIPFDGDGEFDTDGITFVPPSSGGDDKPGGTKDSLIITGIPSQFNGDYAVAFLEDPEGNMRNLFVGAADMAIEGDYSMKAAELVLVGGEIKNGRLELAIFDFDMNFWEKNEYFAEYSGSHKNVDAYIYFIKKNHGAVLSEDQFLELSGPMMTMLPIYCSAWGMADELNFTDGRAPAKKLDFLMSQDGEIDLD